MVCGPGLRVWWCGAGSSTVYRAGCRMSHATDPLGLKRSCCCCCWAHSWRVKLRLSVLEGVLFITSVTKQPTTSRHISLPYKHPYWPVLDFPYHLITCLVYGIAVVCVIVLITPPPPGLNCDDDFSFFFLLFFPIFPNSCWDSQILNFKIKLYLRGYERKFILHFAPFKRFRNHQHPSIPGVIFTKAFVFNLLPPSDRKTRSGSNIPNNGL